MTRVAKIVRRRCWVVFVLVKLVNEAVITAMTELGDGVIDSLIDFAAHGRIELRSLTGKRWVTIQLLNQHVCATMTHAIHPLFTC